MIEKFGNGGDFIGFLRHAQACQDQAGIAGIGRERMQRLDAPGLVVGAPCRLAVDGDEIVAPGPQRLDPVFEAAPEQDGVDAIDQAAHPALAGHAVVIGREAAQEILVLLAPGDNIIEIVAGRDGGAGQQQQHLAQRIRNPPRLAPVLEPGKMLQKHSDPRPWRIPINGKSDQIIHACALLESERQRIIFPSSMQNRR